MNNSREFKNKIFPVKLIFHFTSFLKRHASYLFDLLLKQKYSQQNSWRKQLWSLLGDFLGHEVFHLLAVAVGMKKQFEKCQKRLHDGYFFWIYKIYSQRKETEGRDDLMYFQTSKEGNKNKFRQEEEKPDIRFFALALQ